jgi:hypothetical protein
MDGRESGRVSERERDGTECYRRTARYWLWRAMGQVSALPFALPRFPPGPRALSRQTAQDIISFLPPPRSCFPILPPPLLLLLLSLSLSLPFPRSLHAHPFVLQPPLHSFSGHSLDRQSFFFIKKKKTQDFREKIKTRIQKKGFPIALFCVCLVVFSSAESFSNSSETELRDEIQFLHDKP